MIAWPKSHSEVHQQSFKEENINVWQMVVSLYYRCMNIFTWKNVMLAQTCRAADLHPDSGNCKGYIYLRVHMRDQTQGNRWQAKELHKVSSARTCPTQDLCSAHLCIKGRDRDRVVIMRHTVSRVKAQGNGFLHLKKENFKTSH